MFKETGNYFCRTCIFINANILSGISDKRTVDIYIYIYIYIYISAIAMAIRGVKTTATDCA